MGLPKSSFTFFSNILQKNPNELFGQPNRSSSPQKGSLGSESIDKSNSPAKHEKAPQSSKKYSLLSLIFSCQICHNGSSVT